MNIYEMKLDLAKAIRMLEHIGILDMNGHFSYRIPNTNRILINSRKASRASVAVKNIVTVDLDGQLIEGESEPPSEIYIHTSIYKRRSDVNSVVHSHPHWQTVLGIADIPLKPVFLIGSFLDRAYPVYEKSSLIDTVEMGDELADLLGGFPAISIRHHGNVVADKGIVDTFSRSVCLEENAKKQYYAQLLGNIKVMEGENLQRTYETVWTPKIIRKFWDYHHEKTLRDGKFTGVDEE